MSKHGRSSNQSRSEQILKSFIAGGVAGCCAKTTIAPLDRTKILLQVHSKSYSHLGIFPALASIYRTEGVRGLYRGNTVMMVRIFPYAAIQFSCYEQCKRVLYGRMGADSHIARLSCGSIAGITAVLCTYPLDFIRTRLAYQTKDEVIYDGIKDAFRKVYTLDGFKGFYRGITPSIAGMIPYAGISFYTFETLKRNILFSRLDLLCKPNPKYPEELVLRIPVNLVIGGFAGALAQTFSYPLDVTRRRMQLAGVLPHSEHYTSLFRTLKFVYSQHGVYRGLYRGLSINYIRIVPQVSMSFTVYEAMKQLLNLESGIPIRTG
jgi:solute carrier family 25 protein 16